MPVLARFNNQAIFGIAVRVNGPDRPERRVQTNEFPGVDGLEELDCGFPGMYTTVAGAIVGANLAGLVAAKQQLESYWDGFAYPFTDNDGRTWPDCKIVGIEWPERGTPGFGGTVVAFHVTRIKHLRPG